MEVGNENVCNVGCLCIFCLKLTDNYIENCNYTNKIDQYRFFTLIIRHFFNYNSLISANNQEWCVQACKVVSETTINRDGIEPFFENVQICKKCEQMTRKFSDLYHQIKELELRIDCEVGKLRDVMDCADKGMARLAKDELQNTSTFEGGGVTLGEFRSTFMQSCQAYQQIKKNTTAPNVKLAHMVMEDDKSSLNGGKDDRDLQINSGKNINKLNLFTKFY